MKSSTLPFARVPRIRRDLLGLRLLAFSEAIELPAQGVGDLDDSALQDLETRALEAFESIRAKGADADDEDVAEAERLAEIVTSVRTELGTRGAAVEARKNKLESMGAQLDATTTEDDEDGEDAEEAGTVDETPADVVIVDEDVEEREPALVATARAKGGATTRPRVRAKDVGARQTKPAPPARRPIALIAAAGAPDRKSGESFDSLMDVAEAVGKRASEYPATVLPGQQRVQHRNGIALLRKDYEPALVAGAITDSHVLDYAIDQHRLPGNSLVAAGGWCAPSETLYDLAEIEAADGLVDLPEINVARGGIRFTPGPDFRSIFDGTGFAQTEAQAIAGQAKPCYKVPCPPFTEERAGVEGLCITAGILQERAWPELTARVVRGALAAHAHRISAKTIARIVALSTNVATLNSQGGAAAPLLNAIELAVEDVKYRHRMSRNAVLEAIFPAWVFGVIRADLAFRLGVSDFMSIPDAQIRQWFTDRNIVPQFVYDWQDTALGQATAAARWPANVSFVVYPAGTFVRGMGDVISLDTVYDSAGLTQNEFTGLFTEESLLVAKTGHDSRVYTVPICADGTTAAGAGIPCTAAA